MTEYKSAFLKAHFDGCIRVIGRFVEKQEFTVSLLLIVCIYFNNYKGTDSRTWLVANAKLAKEVVACDNHQVL